MEDKAKNKFKRERTTWKIEKGEIRKELGCVKKLIIKQPKKKRKKYKAGKKKKKKGWMNDENKRKKSNVMKNR